MSLTLIYLNQGDKFQSNSQNLQKFQIFAFMNCLNLIMRPPRQSFVGATKEKFNIFANVCSSSKSPFESNSRGFLGKCGFARSAEKDRKEMRGLSNVQTRDKDKIILRCASICKIYCGITNRLNH